MKMSLDQFLEKLAQTPRDWVLAGSLIRCGMNVFGSECPISCLAGRKSWEYPDAARLLGISDDDARDIAYAADINSTKDTHRAELRTKLLEACGL